MATGTWRVSRTTPGPILAPRARRYSENAGVESTTKLAVFGALSLYLSFINLFQMLLQLFGVAREE